MKISNKKGFTLIELTIVVGIIIMLISGLSKTGFGSGMLKLYEKSVINDSIVNIISEVRGYSFNNITLSQELIKGLTNSNDTNAEISRFNNTAASTSYANSKVAFYHALYFTTNPSDGIDNSKTETNNNIYLLQYKQEGIQNIANRTFETFNVNYTTSPQILSDNGQKWYKKYNFPSSRGYYLNKIISWNSAYEGNVDKICETQSTNLTNFYLVFSTANTGYNFYSKNILDKNFDYLLCFSNDENEYGESYGFGLRINRNNLEELFSEKLRESI